MRPILIGQAPGPNTDPSLPLYPHPSTSAGGRLAQFMGLGAEDYIDAFERLNLVQEYPGRRKHDDKFPLYQARLRAGELRPLMRGRTVILMGRKVASAWGEPVAQAEFFEWVRCGTFGTMLAVVPHPSGRNHWYNSSENRQQARIFWMTVIAPLLGQGQPTPRIEEMAA